MKIDDLLGILFLIFFVIGPALRGLLRPRGPLVEEGLPPEIEELLGEPSLQQETVPAPARSATPPAQMTRPEPTARAGTPPVVAPQTAEGHGAGSRSRRRIETAGRDAAEVAKGERAAFAQSRWQEKHVGLPLHSRGIVHGMLWHEVLSEPAYRRLQRARARRKKLLS